MKTIVQYNLDCDFIGCEKWVSYFAGEEEKIVKTGWVIVYPTNPKTEFDCITLCPKHAYLADIFREGINDADRRSAMDKPS